MNGKIIKTEDPYICKSSSPIHTSLDSYLFTRISPFHYFGRSLQLNIFKFDFMTNTPPQPASLYLRTAMPLFEIRLSFKLLPLVTPPLD